VLVACCAALVAAMATFAATASAHAGHAHLPVLGPPAPDWAFPGSADEQREAATAARDEQGRGSFAVELAAAPLEQDGRCVDTAQISGVGTGCRTRDGLVRVQSADGGTVLTHGPDYVESAVDARPTELPTRMVAAIRHASKADILCVPASERHVRLVYAIPADGEDRSAQVIPALRQSAYEMSAVIDNEARSVSPTAGRRVRMLCDGNGDAVVETYRLRSTQSTLLAGGFSSVITEVHASAGTVKSTGTLRYLVYYDADLGSFSGIGQLYNDDAPAVNNYNNSGGMVALQDNSSGTDAPSWYVLLHESTHNMGGVQNSAPDASGFGHCIDGIDVECYEDGSGLYTETTCATLMQYDCDHDSYFNPAPAGGSYLATHWNVGSPTNGYLDAFAAPADTTAPSAPTNLVATGGGTFMRLSWTASTDAGSGVSAYRVYRWTGSSWAIVDDSWPGDTSIDAAWSGIAANTTYTLKVTAYDRRGNESSAAQVSASTGSAGLTRSVSGPMPPPSNLRLTASTSSSVALAWDASISELPIYRVRRRISPAGTWTSGATTYSTSLNYTGLTSGTTYDFQVTAFDSFGHESTPIVVTATTLGGGDLTAPLAPTNVRIAASGGTAPTVAWDAPATAVSYQVQVEGSPGAWSTVGTTADLDFVVRSLPYSSTTNIGVIALDSALNASPRATVSFTAPAAPDTTPPSTSPSITSTSKTMTTITANWTAASDNVGIAGYKLYVARDDTGQFNLAATTTGLSATATGLSPGTTYRVRAVAYDANGYASTSSSYNIVATTSDTTPPSTITGLAASGQTSSSVNLAWNAATDNSGIAMYRVFRQEANLSWTLIGTTTSTSYSVTGLTPSTAYTFGVRAVDLAGLESTATTSVTTATIAAAPDLLAPSQPGSFAAGSVTGTSAALSWTASTDNVGVTGYRVYRQSPNASGTPIGTPTGTSFNATGLTPATTYTLQVSAVDAAGNESTKASVTFTTPDTLAPTAPGSLTASSTTETGTTLTWTASTDNVGVTGYRVSRTAPTSALLTTTTGLSYGVTGLAPAQSYTFTVTATDAAGNQTTSTVNVTTPDSTAPSQPTGAAAGTATATSIPLSWSASTDNVAVATYRVYRQSPNPSATPIATITAPATSTTLTGLASQTSYTFTITARDSAGNESTAATVTAATLDVTPPTQPTGVATTNRTTTTLTLGWNASTDSAGGAVQYQIYRQVSGSWVLQTTTSSTSWQATGLAQSTAYTFGVSAIDGAGNESAKTSHATSTLDLTAPSMPGAITPGTITSTSIALSWGASTDDIAVAGYRVYRQAPNASGTPIATPAATNTTIGALTSGVSYTFAVTAVDAAGNESAARTVTVATTDNIAPAAPGSLAGSALGETSVHLTWAASTDNVAVTGYRVLRVVGGVPSQIATTTSLQYDVSGLQAATAYRFQVEAYDAAGNSSTPATVDVTTPDTTAPSQPPSGTVTSRSDTALALGWGASTDNVGVTGYRIYRTAPTASGAPIATTTGATTYTVTGLTADTDYTFEVAAVDAAGIEGTPRAIAGRTAALPDTIAPTVPTSLAAGSITATSARLTWTASTDAGGVASYRVERFSGSWTLAGSTTGTAFDLAGLNPATTYSYRVIALDAAGNASPDASTQFTTASLADVMPPSAPPGSLQSSATATGSVGLGWAAASDDVGVTGYQVSRFDDGLWTLVATTGDTTISLTDQPVGMVVTYGVAAVDAAGNVGTMLTGQVAVPAPLRSAPNAPTSLMATPTTTTIMLAWADDGTADSWTIEVVRNGVVVSTRTTSTPNAAFGGYLPATTLTFNVRAASDAGTSGAASITTSTLRDTVKPSKPALRRAVALTRGRAALAWTPAYDQYGLARYEVRLVAAGLRMQVLRTSPSARGLTVTRLRRGKTYFISVRAVDRYGNTSAWSNQLRLRAR
jgi:chitodextrinase